MRYRKAISDAAYIEMFRITCTGQFPTLIIGLLFCQVAIIISTQTNDRWCHLFALTGIIIVALRLLLMFLYLRNMRVEIDNLPAVRFAEKLYTIGSLTFASTLGLLGMRTFQIASQSHQLLVTALLLGYAAGMVTRGFALFWNCSISLCLAAVPIIIAIAQRGSDIYSSLAIMLAAFLAGGLESIAYIYDSYVERITLQQKFASLARNDELTGLFNRLSLREGFDVALHDRAPGSLLAVHCLDLDHFKPVNDRFGHPTGDALLRAVSRRLGHALRQHDFAARVGGDEFVVVQTGIEHAWQAERLAQRIIEAIVAPYSINDHEIHIGTSVGIALGCPFVHNDKLDLDELMARADAALYEIKRRNKGSFLIGGERCE